MSQSSIPYLIRHASVIYSYNVIRRVTALSRDSWIRHVSYCFIKTENIVVDEIGRMICSHPLAHAHTYFYITLLCMHDAAKYTIVALNSTVQ